MLAERAGDREDRYMQAITNAKNAAEQAGDQKTVEKLVELYSEIQNQIRDIDRQRRQKVIDSQLWALEQEIEAYGEAIKKVKSLVMK